MIERTWKLLGDPTMIPSLGVIRLLKVKMTTLCGRPTRISMGAHGASTEEEFEVVKLLRTTLHLLCY